MLLMRTLFRVLCRGLCKGYARDHEKSEANSAWKLLPPLWLDTFVDTVGKDKHGSQDHVSASGCDMPFSFDPTAPVDLQAAWVAARRCHWVA